MDVRAEGLKKLLKASTDSSRLQAEIMLRSLRELTQYVLCPLVEVGEFTNQASQN